MAEQKSAQFLVRLPWLTRPYLLGFSAGDIIAVDRLDTKKTVDEIPPQCWPKCIASIAAGYVPDRCKRDR
jgi:hypothetical protein